MWSCIRRSQSADNNESSSVSLSRYRRTSNDNKPSFDGGIKQKTKRRPEAGRSVSSTDANARDIQNPHATNPAKLKNNHRCQNTKDQHKQNAYHSLRWSNGLHLDDNRRPALAAAEAAADGVITTATQTRRRTPQPQQRHQPHQRHNRQWPPAELDHSNLCHAQKLYTGDGNCRKQNFDHPDQHARYIHTDEYHLRDTKTTKENTANGRDTKPMRSRT